MSAALVNHDGTPMRSTVPARRAPAVHRGRHAASAWATDWTERGQQATPFRAAEQASQELGGWNPPQQSPNTELWGARDAIVARSQDLGRNNGYATGINQAKLDAVIGTNWRLIALPNWRALDLDFKTAADWGRSTAAKWRVYAEDPGCWIDAARRLRFTGLLRTEFMTWLLSGEHCSVVKWMPDRVGPGRARYATAFQLIDPDRLSNPYGETESATLRQGVRVGPSGEPLGYHFRDAHPADWPNAAASQVWSYVPRETPWGRPLAVHGFEVERDGQVRGRAPMTSIIEALRLQDVTSRAAASQMILKSMYATTLETEFGADPESAKAVFGVDRETDAALPPNIDWQLNGVQVVTLPPGVRFKVNQLSGNEATQFAQWEAACLRRVAAGSGLSYEEVSKDYSQTNYSSARAAFQQSWKYLTGRSEFMANTSADVKYACWLEEAINIGEVELPRRKDGRLAADFYEARAEWTACRWIGPGRGWIDPVKEVTGSVMKVNANLSTLTDEAAEQGSDIRDILELRAYERDEFVELGLPDQSAQVYRAGGGGGEDDKPSKPAKTEAA